jgi:excisionase family DNA binding protein
MTAEVVQRMADADPMLTVGEVAKRVRTSEATVRRWLREKKLRGVRPGGTRLGWRIPASEVERLLSGDDAPKTRAA